MAQSTFDDEFFTEAASEMREDVESSLERARAALPSADDVWNADADNTLGVLNGLNSALDVSDAGEHLREAKKSYAIGTRADAFEDGEELGAAIREVEQLVTDVEAASEQVGELTSTIPRLRDALDSDDE